LNMGSAASRQAVEAAQASAHAGITTAVAPPSISSSSVNRSPPGVAPVHTVPVQAPAVQPAEKVSHLTDELMTLKAKLALAEAKLRDQRAGCPGIPHTECVLCMDAAVDTVLLPCGHICMCNKCAESLRRGFAPNAVNCPLCRVRVDRAQRIFLPVHQPPPRFAPRHDISAGQSLGASRVTFSSRKLPPVMEAKAEGHARGERSPVSIAWAPLEPQGDDGSALFSKTLPASFEWPVRYDATGHTSMM